MQLPNQVWDDIINQVRQQWTGISQSWKCVEIRPIPQASQNVDVLKDHEAVKQMGSILKVPWLTVLPVLSNSARAVVY